MNILKIYENDLKTSEEIEIMLEIDLDNIVKIDDVYIIVDKFNLLYFYINIYDKYYSALSNINHTENCQIKNIIKLYAKYDILYCNFVKKVCSKFKIEDFTDSKYSYFINRTYNDLRYLPSNPTLYSQLYKSSEAVYNKIHNSCLSLEEKIELVKKYVDMKERMSKLKGYKSFLEQRLFEIGIEKETFMNLINCNLKELDAIEQEKIYYDFDSLMDMFIHASSCYMDKDIISKLFNNVFTNDKSYVLSSYKKPPFIFMNYENNLSDANKLFHEFGHAYHYVLASNNELINYNPNQFISEIFAMTNQIILLDYIGNEESRNLKKIDYNNFLVDAIYTLKFEYYIHENYKNLNIHDLSKYDSNYDKYLNCIFNDYYDLNYSFGYICAIILANKIKQSDVSKEKINELLMSNGNLSATEMLKTINIDLDNIDFLRVIKNQYYNKNGK